MYLRFRRFQMVSELESQTANWPALRQNFPIAIVDNEPFAPVELLRNHGFSLRELGDILDIAAVADYRIVVCDILDVGAALGSDLGGAHLITEIKKRYPDRYVIAYSGGTFGPEYTKSLSYADVFIRRGVPIDDWVESLDTAIRSVGDPLQYWRRVRRVLIESDVPLFEVLLLEDAFVRSIQKRNPFILSKALERAKSKRELTETLDSIATGLIEVGKLAAHLSV